MKKIANTIKQLSLILGILLALSYSNTLSAQTEEDYEVEVEEEEESFFSDGINGSRFESNLKLRLRNSSRPDYQLQWKELKTNQANNSFWL
jgi:hypothetical protein